MPRVIFLTFVFFSIFCPPKSGAAPIQIVTGNPSEASQPRITVSPSGTIHVVFGMRTNHSVYVASSKDGKEFGIPIKVGSISNLALGMRRGPRIVSFEKGFGISAISHSTGHLMAWKSADGVNWGTPTIINTASNSAREGLHSMATDGRQRSFLTWLDLRSGRTELWGSLSTNGGASWADNILVYKSPSTHICECCHPSAAISKTGEIFVLFRNYLGGNRDMYLTSSKDGLNWSAAERLGQTSWRLQGCPMDGGSLVIDAKGRPVTIWRRDTSIFVARPGVSEQMIVAQGVQPEFELQRGVPVAVWTRGSAMMRLDAKGSVTTVAQPGAYPSLFRSPDLDQIFAVWEGGGKIWFDVFN